MNFCTKCGNQLKPDARFCSKCGQSVPAEVKPVQDTTTQQTLCSKCGTQLTSGVKFCTSCGAPARVTAPNVQPVANSSLSAPIPPATQPIRQPAQIQVPTTSSSTPKQRKKGKKILVFSVSAIVLLAASGAALYFFSIFEPKESYADLSALYEEEKVDQTKIDSVAIAVENIFLSGDTNKLAEILSPTTLEQKRKFFKELQPHMAAFGQVLKTRKFLYGTACFAVYEISSDGEKFTAEFCLGENGHWKLMRF